MTGQWLFERKPKRRLRVSRKRRSPLARPVPPTTRVAFDLNIATAMELLDCVAVRSRWYTTRRLPVPHATNIAMKMMLEVLGPLVKVLR